MKHLLTLENIIYTGQIDLSNWSEAEDIKFFNEIAKKAKGENKVFNISGPGYTHVSYVDNVVKYKSEPGKSWNKLRVNTGWKQIEFYYEDRKKIIYGDPKILNRLNGPARIVKAGNTYKYFYFYEGKVIARDIATGAKNIDNEKVQRLKYISATGENVGRACKCDIEYVLSKNLFRLKGLPDMMLDDFNNTISTLESNLLGNFNIKISGFDGINITCILKDEVDLDKASFDKHKKLTNLGII